MFEPDYPSSGIRIHIAGLFFFSKLNFLPGIPEAERVAAFSRKTPKSCRCCRSVLKVLLMAGNF